MSTASNTARPSSSVRVSPIKVLRGSLSVPGDKSISHRAAIIAAMAHEGISRITNFSTSEDCQSTLNCLRQLGVEIKHEEPTTVCIEAAGARGFRPAGKPVDCGNSGTTMRMLVGALAGQDVVATLTGDESLLARPMKRIIEPLTQMGARVFSTDERAPLTVLGQRPLRSICCEMPVASAQVKSAILLAGLNASGRTEVIEAEGVTRDHTERLLRRFDVEVESKTIAHNGAARTHTTIKGLQQFAGRDISVPGDISSAAFFIAAAAILPNSELEITTVGLNPTRTGFLRTLQLLGAQIEMKNVRAECNEPVANIYIKGVDDLVPFEPQANLIRGPMVAQLIDELPILAVTGSQVFGGIEIRDAGELRLKESDRIAATVKNLREMGAEVEEFDDGLVVDGPTRLRGAVIDSGGDHRIAMAFAIAALMASGESKIEGADCVRISFPEFFQLLESLIVR
jgi:3-phosphoshikimate 1-carboxyvinyltransferase